MSVPPVSPTGCSGRNPADIPVERLSRYELVISMKTAKALDVTLPPSLLLWANEFIRAIGLVVPQSVLLCAEDVIT